MASLLPDLGTDAAIRVPVTLPAAPASTPVARRLLRSILRAHVGEAAMADVELMLSELVTNAAACGGWCSITISEPSDGVLRIDVSDQDDEAPVLRADGELAESGRGLRIVDALATAWGTEQRGHLGKTVWFELRC